MSTIAAALNSCSSLVAVDIIKRMKPDVSDEKQVRYGRITAVVVMIVSIVWSTQGGKFGSIFQAINDIAAAIAPPISAVFLLGIFYKRGTKEAAFYTLVIGFIMGVTLFLLDFEAVSGYKYISHGMGIHFLMRGWWLFCISTIMFLIISNLTPKPDPKLLVNTTWESPREVLQGPITGVTDIRIVAAALLVLMVILYLFLG